MYSAEILGYRLYEMRRKNGLTQRELAQKAGITQRLISDYETGNRTPKLETVAKLADALEVKAAWLAGFE